MHRMADPGAERLDDVSPCDGATLIQYPEPFQPPFEAYDIAPLQPPVSRKNGQAEERHAPVGPEDAALVLVQGELEDRQIFLDVSLHSPQKCLVVMENHEVIHVAQIETATQSLLYEMVKAVEIDIREELARQISYWDAYWMDANHRPLYDASAESYRSARAYQGNRSSVR